MCVCVCVHVCLLSHFPPVHATRQHNSDIYQQVSCCNALRKGDIIRKIATFKCYGVFFCVSMTQNGLGHLSIQLLFHIFSLKTMRQICIHLYLSISMTSTSLRYSI